MTLSELIKHVGDENVQMQNLAASLIGFEKRGHHTEITFGTEAVSAIELMTNSTPLMGLVIWLPRDKLPNKNETEGKK